MQVYFAQRRLEEQHGTALASRVLAPVPEAPCVWCKLNTISNSARSYFSVGLGKIWVKFMLSKSVFSQRCVCTEGIACFVYVLQMKLYMQMFSTFSM